MAQRKNNKVGALQMETDLKKVCENILELVNYGVKKGLCHNDDKIYIINKIMDVIRIDEFHEDVLKKVYDTTYKDTGNEPSVYLEVIMDYCIKTGLINDNIAEKDLLDTKIMDILMPQPSYVRKKFAFLYDSSPKEATDYYYNLSMDSNYIRRDRIAKDVKWVTETKYGRLDITINLSKPEKDPKAIAAAKLLKQSGYPKCLLCKENEGYAGRLNHPARQNHRIIPLDFPDGKWYLQYSPYVYYNEHCIVFNGEHTPMTINDQTLKKLLDFVSMFPHYFIGSNADLPIVGGSILTHEHFQGGCYNFAMASAPIEKEIVFKGYENIKAGIVKWPMSVIRITGEKEDVESLSCKILKAWREYTDEEAFIFSKTDGEIHNTITPIARRADNKFQMDLVLRNNITTKEYPFGVFHPHEELHHIKKENIGLIEVMGLAVLPARLKTELELLADYALINKDFADDDRTAIHKKWADEIINRSDVKKDLNEINNDNEKKTYLMELFRFETGKVFEKVLEDAGVYKCNEEGRRAFLKFIYSI